MTLGLRGTRSAVLISQRKIPDRLLDTSSSASTDGLNDGSLCSRLAAVTPSIGIACAGRLPDARTLVARARHEAANFRYRYGYDCPVDHVARRLANLAQLATQEAAMRPLAVSATLVGWDAERQVPALHRVDPAGFYTGYYGVASGPRAADAMTALEKAMVQNPSGCPGFGATAEEVVTAGLRVLQKVLGQRVAPDEVEVGVCDPDLSDGLFTMWHASQIATIIDALDRE